MSSPKTTIHFNPETNNIFLSPPAPNEFIEELATQLCMNILFGALATLPKDALLKALEESRVRETQSYLEQCGDQLDFGKPQTPNMILQKSMIEGLSKEVTADIIKNLDSAIFELNNPIVDTQTQ